MKESWKPGTLIYPLPAVLVSCGATSGEYNLLTVAWTGTVCTDPPMCYVSVRPERHSYGIIRRTGEFVINLTTRGLARAADWCGVRSGRDYDKFREMGLTPGKALKVAAPIVEESPVSIECRVRQVLELGTHDMFLAEVVAVQVDADYIDPATGRFCLERACPIVYSLARAGLCAYAHGEYFALGEALVHFGWSVRKKPRPKTSKSVAGTKPVTGTKSLTGTKLVAKTKSLTGTKPASDVESADRTSSASAMTPASASSAAVSSLASSSSSASPSSSASALSSSASSAALSAGPNSNPNPSRNSSRNPKRNPDRRQGRKSGPEKPRRR